MKALIYNLNILCQFNSRLFIHHSDSHCSFAVMALALEQAWLIVFTFGSSKMLECSKIVVIDSDIEEVCIDQTNLHTVQEYMEYVSKCFNEGNSHYFGAIFIIIIYYFYKTNQLTVLLVGYHIK